jgi:hypothetical protein
MEALQARVAQLEEERAEVRKGSCATGHWSSSS